MQLQRGQKAKLSDLSKSAIITVETYLQFSNSTIDFSCFGLDSQNKLSDDRYMIFYNQLASPEQAIRIESSPNANPQRFMLDLSKLPTTIHKLVFVGTIDGQGSMSSLQRGGFKLFDVNQSQVASAEFNASDFSTEKAVMMLEIYKKDNVWRLSNVGQGFAEGLSGVLKYFGGEETASAPTQTQQSTSSATQSAPQTQPPKLSLTKITLTKRGDSQKIDLSKRTSNQPIHINLNWTCNDSQNQSNSSESKGFWGVIKDALTNPQTDGKTDLDLGCMYQLTNGDEGVIQALGGNFGNSQNTPFIYLDKDDRSGRITDGENLYLYRPDLIKRVLIFAFIYEGTAMFKSVNGRVVIKDGGQNEITIDLDNPDSYNGFCAICMIENINQHIKITKEELYFKNHKVADHHYNFGFNWTAGSKD